MEKDELITVEVTYARSNEQVITELQVNDGTTVGQAIELSGILHNHPEIDLAINKVGIFGKLSKPDQVLRAGDRVEIYRPLLADPKEVRKLRAAQGKTTRRGAKEINQEGTDQESAS